MELLLNSIFPFLSVADSVSLCQTSWRFFSLLADQALWKRQCLSSFPVPASITSRIKNWKALCRELHSSHLYAWGNIEYTWGLADLSPEYGGIAGTPGVWFGTAHPIPHPAHPKAIAGMATSGCYCHAVDSEGRLFIWGSAFSTHYKSESLGEIATPLYEPLHLDLPAPVKSVSCGTSHATVLDAHGCVWTFLFEHPKAPFRLLTRLLDGRSPDSTVAQVECGWGFCSALSESGSVYVWWPSEGKLRHLYDEHIGPLEDQDMTVVNHNVKFIRCATQSLRFDPTILPPIPTSLPRLKSGEYADGKPKLVAIAAMQSHLIGLTNEGHVLKFCELSNEYNCQWGYWEYLPFFSEVEKVRTHPLFCQSSKDGGLIPPEALRITHVSANYKSFAAYTVGPESLVLFGSSSSDSLSRANMFHELHHRHVIAVAFGDQHQAALTAYGEIFTWGRSYDGALGLDYANVLRKTSTGGLFRSSHVKVPTRVLFDPDGRPEKELFCISMTAAGSHTAAVMIDLKNIEMTEEEEQPLPCGLLL